MLLTDNDQRYTDILTKTHTDYPFFMDKFIYDIIGYIHENLCSKTGHKPFQITPNMAIKDFLLRTGCNKIEFIVAVIDCFDVYLDLSDKNRFSTLQDIIAFLRMNISTSSSQRLTIEI